MDICYGCHYVLSILVLYINLHKLFKRMECGFISASLLSVKTWMEGTHGTPYKNPYFFVTTEPNWLGFRQDADN